MSGAADLYSAESGKIDLKNAPEAGTEVKPDEGTLTYGAGDGFLEEIDLAEPGRRRG